MKINFLFIFSFLCLPILMHSQTILEGNITDDESGEPIIFGTIAIYQNDVLITGTETDFEGYFSFTDLKSGIYDVVFSYTGYIDLKISGVIIQPNKIQPTKCKNTGRRHHLHPYLYANHSHHPKRQPDPRGLLFPATK